MSDTFRYPILPGFYPDPSICRVGDDYWLVTSSFSYFPGVPVFHSLDLVNWEQVGHVLDRPSQLDLDGVQHSHGIFAPTIRHHDGIFYMITTLVGKQGNFIVTAKNPAGPWSDPYWLEDAPGIDPSLFFEEDGSVWVTGTADSPDAAYWGDNEIWMRELDLETMKLTGPRYGLWRGAAKQAHWPEAPHLYRIGEWYYLIIAEGGTEYHHAVTIARSKNLKGPYEGNPANPILTQRHLGKTASIWNAGHADLVQTQTGEWWMVCLASRPYGGHFRNLGRETFLTPVVWEDEWPVVSPGTGKLEFQYPVPNMNAVSNGSATWPLFAARSSQCDGCAEKVVEYTAKTGECADKAGGSTGKTGGSTGKTGGSTGKTGGSTDKTGGCAEKSGGCCGSSGRPSLPGVTAFSGAVSHMPTYICDYDGFDSERLPFSFNFLRTPRETWWSLTERPGFLRLHLRPVFLGEQENPCFIGRRQQHMTFTVTTELSFSPDGEGQAAGLALLQSDAFHMLFVVIRSGEACWARLIRCEKGEEELLAEAELSSLDEIPADGLRLLLKVEAEEQNLRFLCGLDESRMAILAEGVDARMLSTDVAGGFVGTYIGMYAEGENPTGRMVADFDSFSYEGC